MYLPDAKNNLFEDNFLVNKLKLLGSYNVPIVHKEIELTTSDLLNIGVYHDLDIIYHL
jgi:hypothetical protein